MIFLYILVRNDWAKVERTTHIIVEYQNMGPTDQTLEQQRQLLQGRSATARARRGEI